MEGLKNERIIRKKYQEENPVYSEQELLWLLENIGHPDGAVRDDLVFNSLARGLQEGLFTQNQARFLLEQSMAQNGLKCYVSPAGQATLTRSFTALLYANFLYVDRSQGSLYYQFLSAEESESLIQQAQNYLSSETDTTAYTEEFGWVHAFAHGADFLTEAVCHPRFSEKDFPQILTLLEQVFHRVNKRFTDDEDWRLARAIYQPILENKLQQDLVAEWLKRQGFSFETRQDFQRFSNFRSAMLEVFVQLSQENQLQDDLKQAILEMGF